MFPFLKKSSFFAQTFISRILSISNPQWINGSMAENVQEQKFNMPISSTYVNGIACDGGDSPNTMGITGETGLVTIYKHRTSMAGFNAIFLTH